MNPRTYLPLHIVLVGLLASTPSALSQTRSPKDKKLSATQSAVVKADKAGKTTPPDKASAAIASKISEALDQLPSPGADYIPCRFTYAELSSLTTPDAVLTLTPNTAEALVQKVTAAIVQQQTAGQITLETEGDLLEAITRDSLTGLTPSQALQKIIITLQAAQAKVLRVSAAAKVKVLAEQSEEASENNSKTASADKAVPVSASAKNGSKSVNDQDAETTENQGIAPIINSARDTIAGLIRPADVGCAMSVLSYKESSRAYGSIIASNYIAVQVVVRNLNRDQQFVLHDVEYAVNADPSGRSGRFYSGRDKIIVRALAAAEGSFDPRNIIVHGAQSLGALMSTLVPIYGGGIGDAAAVFNGGFYPGLDKVWKDMSTDQLNLLNDTGFSSSSSSQTVVPKAGTVMFVTFIPSKQFEQGWWTQNCAASTALGTISKNQIKALIPLVRDAKTEAAAPSIDLERAMEVCSYQALVRNNQEKSQQKVKKKAFDSQTTLVPVDLGDQTPSLKHDDAACKSATDVYNENEKKHTPTDEDREAVENARKDGTLFATVPKRLYRNWSGNSVALFEELSTTVVAGMHILDEKDLETTVSLVSCNPDSTGKIQFPSPDTGTLECQLKGKNLDKINLLRLRNANDATFADGSVAVTRSAPQVFRLLRCARCRRPITPSRPSINLAWKPQQARRCISICLPA